MPDFVNALAQHAAFPNNLGPSVIRKDLAESIARQLQSRAAALFKDADIKGVQLTDERDQRLKTYTIKSLDELKQHVDASAPEQRYIHITAGNARRPLEITTDMFCWLMTWHRVTPRFLDFVFPFGSQDDGRRDPHTGGFYGNSQFHTVQPESVAIGDRRSDQYLQCCYTLQAPEPGRGSQRWSIRQASVWHELDLQNERQVWLVIKANDILKHQFKQTVKDCRAKNREHENVVSRALRSSLAMHLEICAWSMENWQQYITSLEEVAKESLKPTLEVTLLRSDTAKTGQSMMSTEKRVSEKSSLSSKHLWKQARQWRLHRKLIDVEKALPEVELSAEEDPEIPDFAFRDLQDVQQKEETANTAKMILISNASIMERLRREYGRLSMLRPSVPIVSASSQLDDFDHKLQECIAMCAFLQARVDAYAKVLQDRRRLLETALQAQSTARMEEMTRYMHKEAVRMRVITVVTVLFLPATFASSFLNTSILTFPDGTTGLWDVSLMDTILGKGALEVFFLITIPAMIVVSALWIAMQRREKSL